MENPNNLSAPSVLTIGEPPDINALVAMSDMELMQVLGFSNKLNEVKLNLSRLAELDGTKREEAERRIGRLLSPEVYTGEIGWIADDLTKKKASDSRILAGKEEPYDLVD